MKSPESSRSVHHTKLWVSDKRKHAIIPYFSGEICKSSAENTFLVSSIFASLKQQFSQWHERKNDPEAIVTQTKLYMQNGSSDPRTSKNRSPAFETQNFSGLLSKIDNVIGVSIWASFPFKKWLSWRVLRRTLK